MTTPKLHQRVIVGGPLCECGHEGDLYHYTDGARGCTAGDCPCVRLRWARPVLPEVTRG